MRIERFKIKKFILIIVLASFCLVLWRNTRKIEDMELSRGFSKAEQIALTVPVGNHSRQIRLWTSENEDGRGYFFLPAQVALEECYFIYPSNCIVAISGAVLQSFQHLDDILIGVPYLFAFQDGDGTLFTQEVVFLQSANLPAIYIETESDSLDYIHEDKANKENAFIEIVNESGGIDYCEALEYIKGHGNQTWSFDKRPYQIKLKEESSLLGMGSGDKWLLMANRYDPSHIRNSVVHDLAEAAGMAYTSKMCYADLYINEEYMGNYQLVEKIDIGSARIDIKDLESENNNINVSDYKQNSTFEDDGRRKGVLDMENPRDITGGYLLERNYGEKYESKVSGFITNADEKFIVRSPSYASREQINYISEIVQHAENAILAADGFDKETGLYYTELIDLDSFVKKYLIEELTLNEANGATSSWFYKPEDSIDNKLYAGPVWDYDKALGRRGDFKNPNLLTKLRCYSKEEVKWFYELYKKDDFQVEVKKDYRLIFLPEIRKLIEEKIDAYAESISASMYMDEIRWADKSILPSYGENDFVADVHYLKEWLKLRQAFLNRVWLEDAEMCLIRYKDEKGKLYPFMSVEINSKLEFLPEGEDMELEDGTIVPFKGWYNEKTGKPCEIGEVVAEDITLLPIY